MSPRRLWQDRPGCASDADQLARRRRRGATPQSPSAASPASPFLRFLANCRSIAEVGSPASGTDVLRLCRWCNTIGVMKTLTVRLPEVLVAQIEAESRRRKLSKSDVVRERLTGPVRPHQPPASVEAIADVVGSVDGLPRDLSARTKKYLKSTSYGRKRTR